MQKNKSWKFSLIATSLLILNCAVIAIAQSAAPSVTNNVEKMEEYMNAIAQQKFHGVVLVSRNGQPVYRKGVGLANREFDIPNTSQIKFRIGSVTKQFTAAAILLLQEQGKLKVTDPVCKYFDKCPAAWSEITIHHLVTHTSGIPNYTSFPDYRSKMTLPDSITLMIDRFKDKPLDFKPGEKMSYSNSGYFTLGYIIEKTSGESYEKYLQKNIFDRLNMKNSGYDNTKSILKNRASGYDRTSDGEINARFLDMGQPYAAGSLYSTIDDLFIWNEALYNGKLLSADSFATMIKPVLNNYSYGLFTDQKFKRKRLNHAGGIDGFETFLCRFPDENVTVVVLRNTSFGRYRPGDVADTLSAILFNEKYTIPRDRASIKVDPKIFDAYVGRYELEPNFIITIMKEGDKLMSKATGQPTFELFAESETKYFFKEIPVQMTFVKNKEGIVTHLILHEKEDQQAKKLD